MSITNFRKVLIYILLIFIAIYFTTSNIVSINERANTELTQSSYRVNEYLNIVYNFINDVSQIGSQYFDIDDVKLDSDIENIVFNDDNTYNTPDELMQQNRRLIGIGSKEDVMENLYYINVAYIFDKFFSDISIGFSHITSVSYYSTHNFVYIYSNIGEDYLKTFNFEDEKISNELTIEKFEKGESSIWSPAINKNYLNNKELVLSVPVYNDTKIEGIININYSLDVLQNILNNNFYETYLIDKNGFILASNYVNAYLDGEFSNVIENELFGLTRGKSILDYAFNIFDDDWSTINLNYYKFSDTILDEFVIFMYIPIYTYFSNIIIGLLSVFFIGLIVFWLEQVYGKITHMRNSLNEKYDETSKLKVELEKVATVDFLTKLYNRRFLFGKLDDLRNNNKSNSDANFIILIMDIDHFKKVNDTYGHAFGDEVLKTVSNCVSKNVRKSDLVCRWGGEEILVIIVNSDIKDGLYVAKKIKDKVSSVTTKFENTLVNVTLSIGIKEVKMTDEFDKALTDADAALYHAKKTGRNKIVLYDDI